MQGKLIKVTKNFEFQDGDSRVLNQMWNHSKYWGPMFCMPIKLVGYRYMIDRH